VVCDHYRYHRRCILPAATAEHVSAGGGGGAAPLGRTEGEVLLEIRRHGDERTAAARDRCTGRAYELTAEKIQGW